MNIFFSYFPDDATNSPSPKPWKNDSPQAALDYYNAKDQWLSTWDTSGDGHLIGEDSALQIDYIKVWAL